jgi:hypothetical protein
MTLGYVTRAYTGKDRWMKYSETVVVKPLYNGNWKRKVTVTYTEVRERELVCGHWERADLGSEKVSFCSKCSE